MVPEFDADWGLETLVHVGEHWIDSLLKVQSALPCPSLLCQKKICSACTCKTLRQFLRESEACAYE